MQLPDEFKRMFQAVFGDEQWRSYLCALEAPPQKGVRVNFLRTQPELHDVFSAHFEPIPWARDAYFIAQEDRLGKDPLHASGCLYVQEPSAMAPVEVLAPRPNERVLDLCAAPGSKTTQIAAFMDNSGFLLANDPEPKRSVILAENVERMGVLHAQVTQLLPEHLAPHYQSYFDRILVDAPCSGEGMFRKETEAIAAWHGDLPGQSADRQLGILESAYRMLADGGRLVYSTCTLNPIENEAVCAVFSARHPEVKLQKASLPEARAGLSGIDLYEASQRYDKLAKWLACHGVDPRSAHTEYAIRYFPHLSRGEGHFIACFEVKRKAHVGDAQDTQARPKRPNSQGADLIQAFTQFANSFFTHGFLQRLESTHKLHVDHTVLYAIPAQIDLAHGVLRAGLPLASMPHRHLVPSHALALAMTPGDTEHEVRLAYGDQRIVDFLMGREILIDELATSKNITADGWVWVTLAGAPLGFGKKVGRVVKNHYPKGLRRPYVFALDESVLDSPKHL